MQTRHGGRIVPHGLLGHAFRISLRLGHCDTRLKPSHHIEVPRGGSGCQFLFSETHWNPQIAVVQASGHQRELKVARHYADHHVRLAVQENPGSQHARIAVQAALPKRVAKDGYLFLLVIFTLSEEAADERLDLQNRKYSSRKARAIHWRCLANTG